MEKVRIGIIGIGNMGSAHAIMLRDGVIPGAELAAVCDLKPTRLEWAKATLGEGVALFEDADRMLTSGLIDAVIVATPHYLHPVYGIKALRQGLHLLVEKPEGVYVKQVRELNETAEKSDRVFGLMFNQRTNPLYQKARELVTSGELGELRRSNWIITDWFRTQSYYDSGEWRATWAGEGGGVLMNQAPHQLDLWQWICGMPVSVLGLCSCGKYHNIEVEDDVTAYAEYANGATGVFITTTGNSPGTNRFEITGDRGKLVIEDNKLSFWQTRVPVSQYSKEALDGFSTPEVWRCEVPVVGENPQHKGILKNWVEAILKGKPLLAPGVEGINGVTLCNAIYLSSWKNCRVAIPFDDGEYYELLKKRIEGSSYKKQVKEQTFNLNGTY